MKKNYFFIYLVSLFMLLNSCNGGSGNGNREENTPNENTPVENISKQVFNVMYNADTMAVIEIKGDNVKIYLPESKSILVSKPKGEKTKYYLNDELVNEVKYKDYGFKLRDMFGNLLWKVKIYEGEKIKISDNEENQNPYKIKFKENNYSKLVKVTDNTESELAKVKFKNGRVEIDGDLFYTVDSDVHHPAFAVLEILDMNFTDRLIIISELIKKGY